MTWLIYLTLIIAPLITYPKSIDPFSAKTLLISITGLACLGYWITKEWKGIASIPLYFWWCLISFGYCQYKLGNPGIELILMIAYLGVFLFSRDYLNKETVVKILLISLTITIIFNFYLVHPDWLTIKGVFGLHRTVWGAPSFINMRIYGGWLVLLIPIAFAVMVKKSIKVITKVNLISVGLEGVDCDVLESHYSPALFYKVIAGLLFAAGLFAIWCSGGRSAMLGLTAGLAVFSLFYWGKRAWIPILIIIGLFGFIGWNSFSHNIIDPSRAHFWRGVIPQIQAHPIIGTGIGSFRVEYPLFKENIGEGANPMHLLENCHNEFLQIITETGIIGLCLFLWLIYKTFKRADESNIYNLAMISGVFGCLVDNFYNISLRYSAVAMLFWVYLGILYGSQREEPKREKKTWIQRLSEFSDYCFFN